jgi:hypothetical protein
MQLYNLKLSIVLREQMLTGKIAGQKECQGYRLNMQIYLARLATLIRRRIISARPWTAILTQIWFT